MNLFFIDRCPIKSAQQLCDKHVVKMVLETAQMCSTALHEWDEALISTYKSAYKNHPMTVWVRENMPNFYWALTHGLAIGKEYTHRYGKHHKSTAVLLEMRDTFMDEHDHYKFYTPPPQCMPDEYKHEDTVTAYRNYYFGAKKSFAKWAYSDTPDWWIQTEEHNELLAL